jgi:hypothetical protein
MKTKWKRALTLGLIVMGLGAVGKEVQAASTDTMTVSVTPNAQYAVTITSAYAGGYNFGLVNLNATTQSTVAVVVTNSGTVYEYFGISVSNTSGNWASSTVTPSTDTFRLSALLNATTQPAVGSANFSALTISPPGTANGSYGQGSRTPSTAGSNTQNLWLKLEMPFTLNTGGAGAQTMTLSVTGQAS